MKGSNYLSELFDIMKTTEPKDEIGTKIEYDEAIDSCFEAFLSTQKSDNKLMFIGNGGSAAIASHCAIDYWKNGGIRALCFNEGPLLTCIGNDYGYEEVFRKPIEMFADGGDVLVAISSSGQSQNILNGVVAAREKGCKVITLSGFSDDNPLKEKGDINFYVPSFSYGYVELAHQIILHCILDIMIETK